MGNARKEPMQCDVMLTMSIPGMPAMNAKGDNMHAATCMSRFVALKRIFHKMNIVLAGLGANVMPVQGTVIGQAIHRRSIYDVSITMYTIV